MIQEFQLPNHWKEYLIFKIAVNLELAYTIHQKLTRSLK